MSTRLHAGAQTRACTPPARNSTPHGSRRCGLTLILYRSLSLLAATFASGQPGNLAGEDRRLHGFRNVALHVGQHVAKSFISARDAGKRDGRYASAALGLERLHLADQGVEIMIR